MKKTGCASESGSSATSAAANVSQKPLISSSGAVNHCCKAVRDAVLTSFEQVKSTHSIILRRINFVFVVFGGSDDNPSM